MIKAIAALILVSVSVLSPMSASSAGSATPEGLKVRTVCYGDETPTTLPPLGVDQVRVSVTVDQSTLVQLNADGSIKAVTTNTGCTPKATDVFGVDGGGQVSDAIKAEVLANTTWYGDWTQPGVWHQF